MHSCVRVVASVVALAGSCALAAPSVAANYGSAILSTYRSCAAVAAAGICDGTGPGQQVLWPVGSPFAPPAGPNGPSLYAGGASLSASGSFTTPEGSDTSTVSFVTPNSEPVFSGSTDSIGDVRLGANGVSFYTYTNTSLLAVPLILSASVTFDSSSASPDGAALPDGAEWDASVAIVSSAYLDAELFGPASNAYGSGLPPDLAFEVDLINPGVPGCGVSGVYAAGATGATTSGGGGGGGVTSSACSGGGAYDVAPGQTVIIMDGFHLDANRGGEIDPLTLTYTSAPTPNVLSPLAPIPEPRAWMLLLAGVGFVGGALRRRARSETLPA